MSGQRFDLVHCRSYISAWVAVRLKSKYGTPFLFDMRGFWVDERVEGGLWNLKNVFFNRAYQWAKLEEVKLLRQADGVISLTQAALHPIHRWLAGTKQPIFQVIPCSVDTDLFTLPTSTSRTTARARLGLTSEHLVLGYLGSLGTWYLLDEMVDFFRLLRAEHHHAKFLFITPGEQEKVKDLFLRKGLSLTDCLLTTASRQEVAHLLAAVDVGIMFIKPSFSKTASSPTKLGEMLATGIPVVCNAPVGDVEEIIQRTDGGIALHDFKEDSFRSVISLLPQFLAADRSQIRARALDYYDLPLAIEKYDSVYQQLSR